MSTKAFPAIEKCIDWSEAVGEASSLEEWKLNHKYARAELANARRILKAAENWPEAHHPCRDYTKCRVCNLREAVAAACRVSQAREKK